jgi:hypothetical protein
MVVRVVCGVEIIVALGVGGRCYSTRNASD